MGSSVLAFPAVFLASLRFVAFNTDLPKNAVSLRRNKFHSSFEPPLIGVAGGCAGKLGQAAWERGVHRIAGLGAGEGGIP